MKISRNVFRKEANMKETKVSVTNFELWLLLSKVHHYIILLRQRELSPYHIPPQQLQVLRIIQALGAKASLTAIAKEAERKADVVSRLVNRMELDGLIVKSKDRPKSRLLKIEITEKGHDLLLISRDSKEIDAVLSFLTPDERQHTYTVLERMLGNLKERSLDDE
jgi:DNA-binding MarR family transcriptional regulator